MLVKECCFYVNTSVQVIESLEVLKKNTAILENTKPWPWTPILYKIFQIWVGWPGPLLNPLISVDTIGTLLLILGPCSLYCITKFVRWVLETIKLQMVITQDYKQLGQLGDNQTYLKMARESFCSSSNPHQCPTSAGSNYRRLILAL